MGERAVQAALRTSGAADPDQRGHKWFGGEPGTSEISLTHSGFLLKIRAIS